MEIELQYLFPVEPRLVVPTELADFQLEGSARVTIIDRFWDGDALQLRRSGSTLRIREQSGSGGPALCWKGVATRRKDGAKQRQEIELPIDHVPTDGAQMTETLAANHLDAMIIADTGLDDLPDLHAIGELRNRRSTHLYRQGLHIVELTWDRITYPTGEGETRLEVETKSPQAAAFLGAMARDLQEIYGERLVPAPHGKSRELCNRLYPDLLANR